MSSNHIWVALTIIGWIVVGITIPLVAYFWKRLDLRIEKLEIWKSSFKGDPMTHEQHLEACKSVQDSSFNLFCRKIDESMNSHKQWLEERLKRLESDMKLYVERIVKDDGKKL
ncbi:MAG: hypothetical protein K6T87_15995 [Roseiflexus sp.]|uniref:hypothetical protein n=1 Tax=Roseiflexus sp. TaxID=2562120 RepID=UPI0025CE0126|nr:hypothetical protein [Roseiflexus sp.]MCL6542058.1 hypothetical protein [Roseiflexus sp.]